MEKYGYHDVDFRGCIQRVEYTTADQAGKRIVKYANVYVPYGYDATNPEKKYNILYVMHGGGGNADAFLDCAPIKNMLDYVIAEGKVQPLLVVFPSYYKTLQRELRKPGSTDERDETLFFQKELIEDLIPAVEGTYHTYAEHVTLDGMKASRMHRGFSGFSMGGCTTWFAFLNNMDYISYFIPLSGDCWALEVMGGFVKAEETAELLKDSVKESGYSKDEYFIYVATGTEDIACKQLNAQVAAMRNYPEVFAEDEDYSKGNFHYLLVEGEEHSYEAVYQYLYKILPYLFMK